MQTCPLTDNKVGHARVFKLVWRTRDCCYKRSDTQRAREREREREREMVKSGVITRTEELPEEVAPFTIENKITERSNEFI